MKKQHKNTISTFARQPHRNVYRYTFHVGYVYYGEVVADIERTFRTYVDTVRSSFGSEGVLFFRNENSGYPHINDVFTIPQDDKLVQDVLHGIFYEIGKFSADELRGAFVDLSLALAITRYEMRITRFLIETRTIASRSDLLRFIDISTAFIRFLVSISQGEIDASESDEDGVTSVKRRYDAVLAASIFLGEINSATGVGKASLPAAMLDYDRIYRGLETSLRVRSRDCARSFSCVYAVDHLTNLINIGEVLDG